MIRKKIVCALLPLFLCSNASFLDKTETYNHPVSSVFSSSKAEAVDEIVDEISKIKKMTLEEKIGQMFMAHLPAKAWNDDAVLRNFVSDIGGVMYFGDELKGKTKEEIASMSKKMQNYSKYPLFISADIEGGAVNRIRHLYKLPSAKSYGKKYDDAKDKKAFLQDFRADASKLAAVLHELGINMNFAPVLDLECGGTFEDYGRCYSKEPEIVAKLAGEWIEQLQQEGILTIGKHFPGHGNADKDSHDGIACITKSIDYINSHDLVPFRKAIEKNISGIMIGYLKTPYDTDNLAPFSKKTIDVLRKQLGYEGLIVSDDLYMPCVRERNHAEMATEAIKAGIDIILEIKANKISSIKDRIKKAVENKEIDEKRIDESVYRILKAKKQIDKPKPAGAERAWKPNAQAKDL